MRVDYNTVNQQAQTLISTNKYSLDFGIIPNTTAQETKNIQAKCYNVTVPTEEIETIDVNIKGHHIAHRGLAIQDKTFEASFYNSSDGNGGTPMDSYRAFKSWMSSVANIKTQTTEDKYISNIVRKATEATGTGISEGISNLVNNTINKYIPSLKLTTPRKDQYTCQAVTLDIYDQANVLQMRYRFNNVFPIKIEGFQLGDNNLLSTVVTFSFDYFDSYTVLETKALQLTEKATNTINNIINKATGGLF